MTAYEFLHSNESEPPDNWSDPEVRKANWGFQEHCIFCSLCSMFDLGNPNTRPCPYGMILLGGV